MTDEQLFEEACKRLDDTCKELGIEIDSSGFMVVVRKKSENGNHGDYLGTYFCGQAIGD